MRLPPHLKDRLVRAAYEGSNFVLSVLGASFLVFQFGAFFRDEDIVVRNADIPGAYTLIGTWVCLVVILALTDRGEK